MISVAETIRRVLDDQGRTQTWVIKRMNLINADLKMNKSKFSAIVVGKRKMSGDELIAFCKAMEITPDEFTESGLRQKEVV